MKITAENIKQAWKKKREKIIKSSIKKTEREIKQRAKQGYTACTTDFDYKFSYDEQEVISNFFIKNGFEVNWCFDDRIKVKWV